MESIAKIFSDLTDEELLILMGEFTFCEEHGFYPEDALLRELCKNVSSITGLDVSSNIMMVQLNFLRECALRWKKIIENK